MHYLSITYLYRYIGIVMNNKTKQKIYNKISKNAQMYDYQKTI